MENYQLAVVEATSFEAQTNTELMGGDALLMQFVAGLIEEDLQAGQQAQMEEIDFMQNSFAAFNGQSNNPDGDHHVTDPNTGKTYDLKGDNAQSELNTLVTEANSELSLDQQETSEYSQGGKSIFGDAQKAAASESKATATIMQLGNTTAQGVGYTTSLLPALAA